ncbi:hypothetical protein [Chryseobacterium potabilaquae]|jgi:hypothetical protein|uniref:TrbL/VirB6 plasmid conjugal transfer protein n=1 Tax=Chryseobacterium potabilaquae TaxID=2675057 RepID=A0A6N4XCH0_9FLAO|nr:hypothetical protein [Chryseobacterium potabilaquae]CAA7197449.1 hypothetical protein CHRY9293_03508 [Chryseobacterium potabilaquae]
MALDLNPLNYAQVAEAFRKITFNHTEMIAFSIGLGVLFAVFNIMRASKPMLENGVDAALFFKLFKEYAHILALILFMPLAIEALEYMFGEISDAYKNGFGNAPKGKVLDLALAQKNELTTFFGRFVNSLNVFSDTSTQGVLIDGGLTLFVKPFFELVNNWSYGLALVYRFIYLGGLKMVSGIALACYIYEPTRSYFYTWVKNLLVCYLLIPGFLFVVVFVDAIRLEYMPTDNYQLGIIIICLMAKIAGFAQIQKTLQSSF